MGDFEVKLSVNAGGQIALQASGPGSDDPAAALWLLREAARNLEAQAGQRALEALGRKVVLPEGITAAGRV